MWNTSRRSELRLPQTLGTQCEGNACLLTSQWTCWEQRQSLMFPFISYYQHWSHKIHSINMSWRKDYMGPIINSHATDSVWESGKPYVVTSQVFLESSCILPHMPFLLNHFSIETCLNGFMFFVAKQSSLRNVCPRLKFMLQQKLLHTIDLQN